ncbi:hypothetical protein PZ938_15115 [Luteipulveratus sp. YIM 133132]|uniref:Lipopolysaccharide assembly protein A domain-containing protein n=1 Tax=Luteipulveratus flavus TaxID=3031728 RepID=A0ABT6C8Y1_9MICO|nr:MULTISPECIES: hypothetical protein [unclassified Luteipulveratus]MDE9366944.1 hypothetical protein [Luteipulveratus sp. YIM 133132]MDF8264782.1 hypothetical protein [Luteipulveratus sp. YIM 133296]
MIAVAIVFIVIAALLVLWFAFATGDSPDVDLSAAGLDVHVGPFVVFLLGAVAMALALAALRFFYWGTRRGARKRRERKELELQARETAKQRDEAVAAREREHARLAERERSADGPLDGRDVDPTRADHDAGRLGDRTRDGDLGGDRRAGADLDADGRPLGRHDDLPPEPRR